MVFERIRTIISTQLNIPEAHMEIDTSFVSELNADSLDIFQIVMALEEEFEIEIPEEYISKIDTIRDAVTYIKIHLGIIEE
ncbi:MAG: acyl carrier protein [Epulopiscium sp. Nuni2H_MBin003]|nr:MAG: acyl carrier protein [Epulopiscium sp. Nuni2H_MBin003]